MRLHYTMFCADYQAVDQFLSNFELSKL